jgi:hypothetical protein
MQAPHVHCALLFVPSFKIFNFTQNLLLNLVFHYASHGILGKESTRGHAIQIAFNHGPRCPFVDHRDSLPCWLQSSFRSHEAPK